MAAQSAPSRGSVGSTHPTFYDTYQGFAQLIDQQIAAGYLRSHAGLYAAPRIVERGAQLTQVQLVEALQRAGYAREKASNIWNGSFQIRENSVLIFPRKESDTRAWIQVNFEGSIASHRFRLTTIQTFSPMLLNLSS